MLHLICLFLISLGAHAQNVTASFDTTAIGENPAAAATRDLGIITPFASVTDVKQSVDDPYKVGATEPSTRNIHLLRLESIVAVKGTTFVPEVYISQNQVTNNVHTVASAAANVGQDTSTSVGLLNNQFNLAWHATPKVKLGVIAFYPQMSFDDSGSAGGGAYSYKATGTLKDLGLGAGVTYLLTPSIAIASFFTSVSESSTMKGSSTASGTTTAVDQSLSTTNKKYGVGVSYQVGTARTGGFRIELSHIEMYMGDENTGGANPGGATADPALGFFGRLANSQNQLAIEATTLGFTGGLTLTRVYGHYLNYRYLADSVFDENSKAPNEPSDSFGGFLGFKSSSGSSFGATASYFSGTSDISFLGQKVNANVTRTSFGVSYAYSF